MAKKFVNEFVTAVCSAFLAGGICAQPPAPATVSPAAEAVVGVNSDDARIRREQAYQKLLEGQRHIWKSQRLQTQAGKANSLRLAKLAFLKAVEIDPTLAEAYTALAEVAITLPPVDLEEAIRLAEQAVKVDSQNFGGHRMLARFYTIKSRLNNGPLDIPFADRAVAEWKEVTRLDPRNAEGWAFLSAFAESQNRISEQIEALRKWISAAPPIDIRFYEETVMRGGSRLSSESAGLKLAEALAKSGKKDEAATLLSGLIADDPGNSEAVALLSELVDSTEGASIPGTVAALKQAIFANPENGTLVDMLARLQARAGQFDDAAALLKGRIASLSGEDARTASSLAVSLAELYQSRDRYDDSIKAFESALSVRGIGSSELAAGESREFAQYVFEKLIHVARLADRPEAARGYIEKARKLLGKNDLFADRQLINLLQSQGNLKEALSLVRSLRTKRTNDVGLLRAEASLLTGLRQVDAAVALIRDRTRPGAAAVSGDGAGTVVVPVPPTDEFSDLLFISNLYTRANRGKEAIEAANQALLAASGTERKQIAKVTLATGLQMSGDTAAAERVLREVLKETPGNPMALNNLGYFLTERGEKLSDAVELIKEALKVDPRNPSYLDSLGWVYFKLGRLDEAEKYLLDAARADLDSATIQEHLGDIYQSKKQPAKAKACWERALRLSIEPGEAARLKKKLMK